MDGLYIVAGADVQRFQLRPYHAWEGTGGRWVEVNIPDHDSLLKGLVKHPMNVFNGLWRKARPTVPLLAEFVIKALDGMGIQRFQSDRTESWLDVVSYLTFIRGHSERLYASQVVNEPICPTTHPRSSYWARCRYRCPWRPWQLLASAPLLFRFCRICCVVPAARCRDPHPPCILLPSRCIPSLHARLSFYEWCLCRTLFFLPYNAPLRLCHSLQYVIMGRQNGVLFYRRVHFALPPSELLLRGRFLFCAVSWAASGRVFGHLTHE